ncbi:DUF4350 domain-containing protein [Streptomyces sp. JJ66]|uniref:DUF4350 domain-containing protein n=1 Tax=Streptomyces sp. JJ66 TaxID=2803843 RepID=UPI001C591F2E|nr:DUF4350 domain-containing protein [Streptomyces sp. JJ66]MBW1603262.1 DUF4350 domain-containing protein [Streptomyces sp. JJ66]
MTSTSSPTSSLSPTARQVWARARGLLVALAVVLLAAVVLAVLRSGEQHGMLDPRSPDRTGSRAVAELLNDRGVDVTVVTTTAGAARATDADTTVLVTSPDRLGEAQRADLRPALSGSGGRTVLLAPGPAAATDLAPAVEAVSPTSTGTLAPRCDAPYAQRAGSVRLGGLGYRVGSGAGAADACYPSGGLPTLLRVPTSAGGDTILTGTAEFLYNERLDEQGNASLALQLLGSRDRLVWYLPSLADPAAGGDGSRGLTDLIPDGWLFGAVQLAVAVAVAALWRARRLGPLVPERLPVAVPAAEATEGRARLYRLAHARDRAADALRSATRTRLAPLLGLPAAQAHTADSVVPAVTRYTGDSRTARSLLFGPAPVDDTSLVRLADSLDELEQRIAPRSLPHVVTTDDVTPEPSAAAPTETLPEAPTDKDGTS